MTTRVELWELPGPHWRMPIRVVWHADLAEVRVGAGARLARRMIEAAEGKLSTVGRFTGNAFWLSKENLGKIATPSRAEDPEEVIEWQSDRKEKPPSNYQAKDFIMGYCAEPCALIREPVLAEAVFVSFCRYMLHWLLNESKEVDLGFAKLNAFTLRRNWQSAAARFEYSLFRKGKITATDLFRTYEQNIVDRGVAEFFISSEASAINEKKKLAVYTLDIRPTREWDQFTMKLEAHRKYVNTGWAYPNAVGARMKRQIKRVIASYAQYLRETRHPNMHIPASTVDSVTGKRSWSGGSCKTAKPPPSWDGDALLRLAGKEGIDGSVEGEDASLPEMPDLQSAEENVRNPR